MPFKHGTPANRLNSSAPAFQNTHSIKGEKVKSIKQMEKDSNITKCTESKSWIKSMVAIEIPDKLLICIILNKALKSAHSLTSTVKGLLPVLANIFSLPKTDVGKCY